MPGIAVGAVGGAIAASMIMRNQHSQNANKVEQNEKKIFFQCHKCSKPYIAKKKTADGYLYQLTRDCDFCWKEEE